MGHVFKRTILGVVKNSVRRRVQEVVCLPAVCYRKGSSSIDHYQSRHKEYERTLPLHFFVASANSLSETFVRHTPSMELAIELE